MNKKLAIIALFVLLAGAGSWLLFYFSDEQVIRRKLIAMADSLSKEGEETPLAIALKMKPVKDFIVPACEVTVPERNYREILDPGLITRLLIQYRARQADLLVTLDKLDIEISGEGESEVSALVQVTANRDRPDFFSETHRVALSMQKKEKEWLLHKAVLPDALVRRY